MLAQARRGSVILVEILDLDWIADEPQMARQALAIDTTMSARQGVLAGQRLFERTDRCHHNTDRPQQIDPFRRCPAKEFRLN